MGGRPGGAGAGRGEGGPAGPSAAGGRPAQRSRAASASRGASRRPRTSSGPGGARGPPEQRPPRPPARPRPAGPRGCGAAGAGGRGPARPALSPDAAPGESPPARRPPPGPGFPPRGRAALFAAARAGARAARGRNGGAGAGSGRERPGRGRRGPGGRRGGGPPAPASRMTLGKRLRRARPGPGRRGAAARRGPWPGVRGGRGLPGRPASGVPAHTRCSGARGKDSTRLSFKFVGGPLEGTSFSHGQKVVRGGWVPRPSHKGLQPSWALRLVLELGGFASAAHPSPRLGLLPPVGGIPGQLVNLVGGIGSWQCWWTELGLWACALGPEMPPRRSPLAPSHLAQATPSCPGPLFQMKSGVHWWGLVPCPLAEHLVYKLVFWRPREGAFRSRDYYFLEGRDLNSHSSNSPSW